GSQSDDPGAPNYDERAEEGEGPVHRVKLDPFFISAFEMTQGQWLQFTGKNPCLYSAGTERGEIVSTLMDPVEQITWNAAQQTLERLGLALPTEAQWEYATRAGTNTPWYTGSTIASLQGHANLADRFAKENGGPVAWIYNLEIHDGYGANAPVNKFRASPFGLHNVHGNVREWCLDAWGAYDNPVAPGTGERLPSSKGPDYRCDRGGSHSGASNLQRSAFRSRMSPLVRRGQLGVRAALNLDPVD
ncbi:MAG: formylglycine-generating enzyme family protein, partial [Planctomycetota bacterium]